jgi:SAM-dependent methyltransferase
MNAGSSSASPLKITLKSALNLLGLGATVRDLRYRTEYFFDAATRRRNARFERNSAPDGLPMPPPTLIYLVTGQFDAEAFYNNGLVGADCIRDVLNRHGLDMSSFSNILDFGCGCGRVIRQWKGLIGSKLYGIDYNPVLIDWCRRNLPFADYSVNRAGIPLGLTDETFDFIYSISVFTHLTESGQRFWMDEIKRVLNPGGHLLFTVHGLSRLRELSPEQRQIFEAGSPVIVGSQYSGTNFCGTYHPEQYVRGVLCKDWHLVAFEPGAAKDANQDIFLMQKPL